MVFYRVTFPWGLPVVPGPIEFAARANLLLPLPISPADSHCAVAPILLPRCRVSGCPPIAYRLPPDGYAAWLDRRRSCEPGAGAGDRRAPRCLDARATKLPPFSFGST